MRSEGAAPGFPAAPTSGIELLRGDRPLARPCRPDTGLADPDLLREAQLTDVRFDPVASKLAVVFDLRQALGHPDADVAVAILTGVQEVGWLGPGSANEYQAWYVMEAVVVREGHWCRADVGLFPSQTLRTRSRSLELFTGRTARFEAAPPDLGVDSPEQIRAGFPRVETQFVAGEFFVLPENR